MMLQMLPDAGIPNTWLDFEKNLLSNDFPPDGFFSQDPASAVQSKPYHPQLELAEHPSLASKRADQFQMRNWMRPHEYRSRILGGPFNKKPVVQRNLSHWRQPFSPFESQSPRMRPQEFQHQSIPQSQYLLGESSRAASIVDIAGRRMASKERGLGLIDQTFDSKSVKAEDPPPTIFQPAAKPKSHLAANNWPSFSDTNDGGEIESGFDSTDDWKDEKDLPDLRDNPFFQGPNLINDGADGASPFQAKRSPDTGSEITEQSYIPGPGSFPWPAYKIPTQSGIQHREVWPMQLAWTHTPCLANGAGNPGFANTEFGSSMSMSHDISGLPALGNDLEGTESTIVEGACGSDLNLGLNREQAAMNSAEIVESSSFDTVDSGNAYQVDSLMYGPEGWPGLAADESDSPIACPNEARDAFLIECKLRGLSYKDIKKIGGFKEAESTLRGRFRTLTKSKEQRVRKPQWQPRDVQLLCEAVNACSESCGRTPNPYDSSRRLRRNKQPPKVSWKKVAQYIWSHGGSYHFGNATCKKKWCEVHNIKKDMMS